MEKEQVINYKAEVYIDGEMRIGKYFKYYADAVDFALTNLEEKGEGLDYCQVIDCNNEVVFREGE